MLKSNQYYRVDHCDGLCIEHLEIAKNLQDAINKAIDDEQDSPNKYAKIWIVTDEEGVRDILVND